MTSFLKKTLIFERGCKCEFFGGQAEKRTLLKAERATESNGCAATFMASGWRTRRGSFGQTNNQNGYDRQWNLLSSNAACARVPLMRLQRWWVSYSSPSVTAAHLHTFSTWLTCFDRACRRLAATAPGIEPARHGRRLSSGVCDGVNVGETRRRCHLLQWDALIFDWKCRAISICHRRAPVPPGGNTEGAARGTMGHFAKQKSRGFQRTAGAAPWPFFLHIWRPFCHVSIY